jgi:hypothetical protein
MACVSREIPRLVSELADGKNERITAAQFRCAAFSSKHLHTDITLVKSVELWRSLTAHSLT